MMGLQSDEEKNQAQEIQKKEIAKAYGKYVKAFTPRPKYVSNCLRAFLVGGQSARQHCGFGTRCRRAGCLKRTREPLLQSPW